MSNYLQITFVILESVIYIYNSHFLPSCFELPMLKGYKNAGNKPVALPFVCTTLAAEGDGQAAAHTCCQILKKTALHFSVKMIAVLMIR